MRSGVTSDRVVYQFGTKTPDGAFPNGTLVNVSGTLYGTTIRGGKYGDGTVYSLSSVGKERVLHSFGKGHDGSLPYDGLLYFDGKLYGTTEVGGEFGGGTVFSVSTDGSEKVITDFPTGGNLAASQPVTGLIAIGNTLYGTSPVGGVYGQGTIYKIKPDTAPAIVLHSFGNGIDGTNPNKLMETGGQIYGTTTSTVFVINPDGSGFRTLYTFGSNGLYDAVSPEGSLTLLGGLLYGVSSEGGKYNDGTVFRVSTGGAEKVLYSLSGYPDDGAAPEVQLVDNHGTLIGTTIQGGESNVGTVFGISTSGSERILYKNFTENGKSGFYPTSAALNVNGVLYGTTQQGGMHNDGIIYALTP